ncbi:MAG TPA: tetratricopeptide repeat protein [Burkholderiales bacterium]|nr:tetratricopeptide repeat protein [Burkholderiales bacterium]
MAYDFEEQEQIDAFKAWWTQYGTIAMLAVIACFLTIAAFQGWRYYRAQQSERAATLFTQLDQAERANEHKKVRDIASQLIGSYGSTHYAGMAALSAAKAGFETGELDDARKNLQWAMEKAREEQMRDVARLRLAGIFLDEKKYDEALKLLSTKPGDAFVALYSDLRGDVLAAQSKNAEARVEYQAALDKSDPGSQYRRLVELKLDALGEAK